MSPEEESHSSKELKRYEKILNGNKKDAKLSVLAELKDLHVGDKKSVRLVESLLGENRNALDWEIRNATVEALGAMGSKHSVSHLLPYLSDPSEVVRESTALSLGQIGDAKAVQGLIAALDDESFGVRENAARSLARIGDRRAVDPMLERVKSDDVEMRLSMMSAISTFEDDERVLNALVDALSDEVTQVRFPAIIAFNKIKYTKAIDPLIDNLETDDPLLQKVASDALVYNLGWGSVIDNKLTKFGEKRRKLLLSVLDFNTTVNGADPEEGNASPENEIMTGAETERERPAVLPNILHDELHDLGNLADYIIDLLRLEPSSGAKLKNFLGDLEQYYTILKK